MQRSFISLITLVFLLSIVMCTSSCYKNEVQKPPVNEEIQNKNGQTEKPEKYQSVTVYYVKITNTDAYLVREVHQVAYNEDPKISALKELIQGEPTTPGAFKVLPPATRINSIKFKNDLATVDFSKEVLQANVGASGEALGIQSIVNTLTEFSEINQVEFTVENKIDERTLDWWGHVGLYEQPFQRDISDVREPAIWVTMPRPGTMINSPLKVTGTAQGVFEGTVNLRLITKEGEKIKETYTTATAKESAERGDFEATLNFDPPASSKEGYLEVFWYSPKDGSEKDKVRVPISFKY